MPGVNWEWTLVCSIIFQMKHQVLYFCLLLGFSANSNAETEQKSGHNREGRNSMFNLLKNSYTELTDDFILMCFTRPFC